jgi:hypothetical protein
MWSSSPRQRPYHLYPDGTYHAIRWYTCPGIKWHQWNGVQHHRHVSITIPITPVISRVIWHIEHPTMQINYLHVLHHHHLRGLTTSHSVPLTALSALTRVHRKRNPTNHHAVIYTIWIVCRHGLVLVGPR